MVITNVKPTVMEVFEITGFVDILVEIIADVEKGGDGNAAGGCGEQAA